MYLLDTCTLSHYFGGTELVVARVNASKSEISICVVGVQESLEGWLRKINQEQPGSPKLIDYYRKLDATVRALNEYTVLPFNENARQAFLQMPASTHTISANHRHVAAIAIARSLIVVTENEKHFKKPLPEDQIQDWTRPD